MSQKTVEVHLAFSFVCPDCGSEGFAKSVMHEFSSEDAAEFAEDVGELPRTGEWLTHPESVTCPRCHHEFRAVNPNELVDA